MRAFALLLLAACSADVPPLDTPPTDHGGTQRPGVALPGSPEDPAVASDGVGGWASVPGNDVTTTTGGGEATPVTVTTFAELRAAAAGTDPAVILVSGTVSGNLAVGSNKTIRGLPGAVLHGQLAMNDAVNVIVQDLTIEGYNCSDTTDCGDGLDAVVLRGSHHVWFDHCDVHNGSDGNMDIVAGSDYVTVSYTRFYYQGERAPDTGNPHRLSNLIGSSEGSAIDVGKLRVTFDHVWWGDAVTERMPFVRYGKVHVINSLFTSAGNNHCITAAYDADVRAEANVFIAVKDPIYVHPSATQATLLGSSGNVFTMTSGSDVERADQAFEPPYAYSLEDASTVEATVMTQAGPR